MRLRDVSREVCFKPWSDASYDVFPRLNARGYTSSDAWALANKFVEVEVVSDVKHILKNSITAA